MTKTNLPQDPDGMNEARADFADTAISAFRGVTGSDVETAIGDLICDLLHLCDRNPQFGGFQKALHNGLSQYAQETNSDAVDVQGVPTAREGKARIRKVCETCGSVRVTHDALASWNEDSQEWELVTCFDNADCEDCGGETHIVDVEISDSDPVCACQNCDWRGLRSKLNDVKDYSERVEPGEPEPDGECPHCGALAHTEED